MRRQLRDRSNQVTALSPSVRSRKYITDTAWDKGWVLPISPKVERAESVGIIGAGPGGLAAADVLRRAGFAGHCL